MNQYRVEERGCCGTLTGSPHRSTCIRYAPKRRESDRHSILLTQARLLALEARVKKLEKKLSGEKE